MTPEEKRLLLETVELARDNNKILHSMRRGARLSMFFSIIYWIIVLGGLAAGWYFIQPYINMLNQSYDQIQLQLNSLKGAADKLPNFNNILRP